MVIRSSYHGKNGEHNFWDFPKGLVEKGEDGLMAAKREASEEAGISEFEIVPDFKTTVRYFIRRDRDEKATIKFVALFLTEAKTDSVTLSWEHDAYEWLLYEAARERVSLPQMRQALEKAEKYLILKEKTMP